MDPADLERATELALEFLEPLEAFDPDLDLDFLEPFEAFDPDLDLEAADDLELELDRDLEHLVRVGTTNEIWVGALASI